jgi:crotonobetainyl-CoA:carnitine CoA-transferase CaiB-like acyl-CoA transferase
MARLPLEGLTILEFTHTVMGPACGVVLADLGADVIRIEPAPKGDPTRYLGGFAAGFFLYFNRNKRSICINIKQAEGLQVAHELIRSADVLIENYGPGTMDRLGCGWEAVHALNPALIYCELKGFLSGPYERRPAMDELVQFMGGLAYMTGLPGQPLRAGASVVDILGGVMGAVAILAALRQRDQDGVGRRVAGTLYESVAFLMAQHMAQEAATGKAVPPMAQRAKAWSVYELYPTRDGKEIFLAVISDRHWRDLCHLLDLDSAALEPRFTDNTARLAHREEISAMIRSATQQRDFDTLCVQLEASGLPFAPLRTPSDLFDDPQLNVEGRMLPIRMPNGEVAKLPPLPFSIEGETMKLRRQPAAAGEHSTEILAGLGHDQTQIDTLVASGAIRR